MPDVTNKFDVNGSGLASGSGMSPDAFYTKALLEMLRNVTFSHRKYLKKQTMPKNYGDTINFRRYSKLAIAVTPLTEGVSPDGVSMAGTAITATVNEYGNIIKGTNKLNGQHIDDVKAEYGQELAMNASESLDYIAREALIAGASAWYAKGTLQSRPTAPVDVDATCVPTLDDFRLIALKMQANNIKPYRGGSANGKYICIVDSVVMYDLLDDTDLKDKYMLTGQTNQPIVDNTIYDIYNIRFDVVNNAKVELVGAGYGEAEGDPTLNGVWSIVLGNEGACEVDLGGAGVQMYTKGLGSSGTEDTLNQRWSMGWRIDGYAVKVLTALAVYKYLSVPTNGAFKFDGSNPINP